MTKNGRYYAMLFEIKCDRFMSHGQPRPAIRFHSGLNTVLGGKSADNSIGKSTFMLIIDYAFGGDTYKDSDAAHHLGNHLIKFAFEFNDTKYYFSRDIVNFNDINICDSSYNTQETIRLDKFKDFLFESYKINLPYTTFRDIIGRYLRIYGKDNHSSTRPLDSYHGEKAEVAITALEKLFNVYWKIEEYKSALSNKEEIKKTFNKARKLELVPFSITTQTQYKKNEAAIQQLKNELSKLIEQTDRKLASDDLAQADEAAEIKGKITALKRQRSRLKSQLEIVNVSISGGFTQSVADLAELAQFFPNANMRKISEVESFHGKMQNILSNELDEESQRLKLLIDSLSKEISSLEDEQRALGIPSKVPKSFLDNYTELQRKISGLEAQNKAYNDTKVFVADVKTAKESLSQAQETELRYIETAINEQMVRFNDVIYGGKRKAPVIDLVDGSKYIFWTPDDSGTGTSYKSLIVFDLSILKLTPLPAIAHDSLIFKNIADEPISNIIKLYKEFDKQIFIAFDKDEAYSEETSKILNETSVLHLNSNGDELFGYSWGETKS
jgi:hypothetical protein